VKQLLRVERVAKFSLGDFNDMLAYQGMQIEEVFGNYQLGKLLLSADIGDVRGY
jgi:hypothetical protein